MNIGDTLRGVERELEGAGVESPKPEAEILVAAVTGLLDEPRADLYRLADRELTHDEARTLAKLVLRRIDGEPVQYIVRRAWFRDLSLEVGPGVLIPRPETELLAGEVLDWIAGKRPDGAPLRVLDIGTGSGCLALAVAAESTNARILGTDISMDALAYAHRNRGRLAVNAPRAAARVGLLAGDLFSPFRPAPVFDVIVSNPPYVDHSEAESLPREVRDHEPEVALFPTGSGTAVLFATIDQATHFLVPGGLLALEIGETQADNVRGQFGKTGSYEPARTVRDLAGRTRLVLAELSPGK
jgi:release factor glutamine methyltransferase